MPLGVTFEMATSRFGASFEDADDERVARLRPFDEKRSDFSRPGPRGLWVVVIAGPRKGLRFHGIARAHAQAPAGAPQMSARLRSACTCGSCLAWLRRSRNRAPTRRRSERFASRVDDRTRLTWRAPALAGASGYSRTSRITLPCTSVSRMSRPLKRYVSFSKSRPSRCRIVACSSYTDFGFSTAG